MKSIKFEKSILPAVRGVAFSASRSSLLSSFVVRSSVRSASGFVAVASFASLNHARLFSVAWARRLPRSIRFYSVRQVGSGSFAVSVPVRPVSVPANVFENKSRVGVVGLAVSILKSVLFDSKFKPFPIKAVPLSPGLCCRLALCNSH